MRLSSLRFECPQHFGARTLGVGPAQRTGADGEVRVHPPRQIECHQGGQQAMQTAARQIEFARKLSQRARLAGAGQGIEDPSSTLHRRHQSLGVRSSVGAGPQRSGRCARLLRAQVHRVRGVCARRGRLRRFAGRFACRFACRCSCRGRRKGGAQPIGRRAVGARSHSLCSGGQGGWVNGLKSAGSSQRAQVSGLNSEGSGRRPEIGAIRGRPGRSTARR